MFWIGEVSFVLHCGFSLSAVVWMFLLICLVCGKIEKNELRKNVFGIVFEGRNRACSTYQRVFVEMCWLVVLVVGETHLFVLN